MFAPASIFRAILLLCALGRGAVCAQPFSGQRPNISGTLSSLVADENGHAGFALFALSENAAALVWRVQIGSRLHTPVFSTLEAGGETYFARVSVGPFTLADNGLPVTISATNAWGTSSVHSTLLVRGRPPVFTGAGAMQPASVTLNLGGQTVLNANAIGSATIRYQWRKDGSNLNGATQSFYSIDHAQLSHAGTYAVVATNDYGTSTSSPATVKVSILPVTFTQQPQSSAVALGSFVTLQTTVTGSLPIFYQWRKDGLNVEGATNSWLSIPKVQSSDLGDYYVFVTNPAGAASSAVAKLVLAPVAPPPPPPSPPPPTIAIAQHPQPTTVIVGGNATFQAAATGTPPITYQWRKDGVPIPNATQAGLNIVNVQPAHAGAYSVVMTNAAGSLTSNSAALVVNLPLVPPAIILPPRSQEALLGTTVELTVGASGSSPFRFQWTRNGVPIAGATQASLPLVSLTHANAGTYAVIVSNAAGSVTSSDTSMAVKNPGRLCNLSVLTSLAAPGDQFALGVVLGGADPGATLPLLIRAAGPSLANFGIADALGDPKIELFSGSIRQGENDDWGGNAAVAAAAAQVGAFSFSSVTSKDAAFFAAAMRVGAASVSVSGAPGNAGAVIAELYDASPREALTIDTPRLINVSVLKAIGSRMTAGFVIDGTTAVTVLIRAVGPSLAQFGVSGFAEDTRVELLRADGTSLSRNDDWGGTTELAATFAKIGAFTLPLSSRDAALLATLMPGSYTVDITGATATSGVALVEIYEVP